MEVQDILLRELINIVDWSYKYGTNSNSTKLNYESYQELMRQLPATSLEHSSPKLKRKGTGGN